jgi:hypothetical protein
MFVSRGHVAERVSPEHAVDCFERRLRLVDQIDLRLGLSVLGKRIVEQMIQNFAVHRRAVGIVTFERGQRRRAGRVGEAAGKLAEFVVAHRHVVGLQIEHDLQSVLHLAEETVVVLQDGLLLMRQAARRGEPLDGDERVARSDLSDGAAVEELEELNDELDIANSAAARLHVPFRDARVLGVLLDLSLEPLDAGDVGEAQVAAVDPRPQVMQIFLAEVEVAGDRPGLDVGLPLPRAAAGVVVGQRVIDAHHERPLPAVGSQPHVDAVGKTQLGRFGDQANHFAGDPLGVFGTVAVRRAVVAGGVLVEHHQVDVAGVVELPAAEFPQGEHDESRRLRAAAVAGRLLLGDLPEGEVDGGFDHRVRHIGNLPRDLRDRVALHDVAVGDPQRLAAFEPAERGEHLVRAAQRADVGHQFLDKHIARDGPAAGHSQQVVALGIAAELVGQRLAVAEQHDQRGQGRTVPLEQCDRGQRAAALEEVALEVVERHVRVGQPRHGGGKLLAQRAKQIERHAGGRQPDEIRVGRSRIGKAERPQPGFGRRGRVEDVSKPIGLHRELQHLQATAQGERAAGERRVVPGEIAASSTESVIVASAGERSNRGTKQRRWR